MRLETDDALEGFYRSTSPDYAAYEAMLRRFAGSESDVLIAVEGTDLMQPHVLEALRQVHLELELADGVAGTASLFSIRRSPVGSTLPPPLVPDTLPAGSEFHKLIDEVRSHPLVRGRLLSDSRDRGDLALFVVGLDRQGLQRRGLGPALREVERVARTAAGPQLRVGLTGVPVMRLEIAEASRRDRIVFTLAGSCVGLLVCFLFFRELRFVIIANAPPLVGVFWTLGLFGFSGVKLNPLMNAILPLLMVVAFTNAMHLIFAVRAQLRGGHDVFTAVERAVFTVGPACVITFSTTLLSQLSMAITDSELIRTFGIASAAGTAVVFLAVMLMVPMLCLALLHQPKERRSSEGLGGDPLAQLQAVCDWLGHWILARHRVLAVSSAVLTTAFTVMYLRVEPYYRLTDIAPPRHQSATVSAALERKLAGIYPLQVMVQWPADLTITSKRVLDAIADVHGVLEAQRLVRNVWSIETLRRWLIGDQRSPGAGLRAYLGQLPVHLKARLMNEPERAAMVAGFIPDLEAKTILKLRDDVETELLALRVRYPEISFSVTGLSVMSSARSVDVIGQLNRSLFSAVIVVIILIGITFGSLQVALFSVLPTQFALVATGAFLHILGWGLEYASIMALTIAYGLAVDDTIHFLSHFEHERGQRRTPAEVTYRTVARIGPIVVMSTLVLMVGMAVTAFSGVPPTRTFGQLTIATLFFALVGIMIILPATIVTASRWAWFRRGADKSSKSLGA
jgi:predicted RND superfamily exporter protein